MSAIVSLYSSIYEKLKAIDERYQNAEGQLGNAAVQDELHRQKRIENLKEQLRKIDEYSAKLESFRKLAEKHLESKNLLTITPRELNFNRLRNWAMMIDPTETDDPYAQRIYVQVKCNELFLAQKKAEFEKTLAELTGAVPVDDEQLKVSMVALKRQLMVQQREILEDREFTAFAELVARRHDRYSDLAGLQSCTENPLEDNMVGIGGIAKALPVFEELRYIAKAKLGEFYDSKFSSVLLPLEHALETEMFFSVGCSAAKAKKFYRGIQNYLLNIVNKSVIGSRKIYFLDALHYNSSALGFLRPLEGTIAMEPVPKDAEQIVDTLKQIVSSFSDIDEVIGLAESVGEFNAAAEPKDRITRTVLVLVGYPTAFPTGANELIKRILLNYEHYGITPILVDTQFAPKKDDEQPVIPVDVVENIFRIRMTQQKELIRHNGNEECHFRWYELRQELSEAFLDRVRSYDTSANTLGTEYVKRVDMTAYPPYERGKKSVVLPYGVDSRDEVYSISFDNENFAAFLMGASGSGKSTLLHTLITGILRNYHPDDVELWLADFKMSEFAQYIDPMPPHIKYILLDESPELVYDLIDKLTEKMMERQRFFMHHRDMKKVENVPGNVYMPVIFVILDEFSIMSQAVAESEVYKLRLQNLLAKGRALGIKFIFASQTFTKGIAGLTQTAKDQIQTRIAMKNSYHEINETLELSSGIRTDQVKNWMEALPPHYALAKYREGDSLHVKRLKVMYFKGRGDEALLPQRKLVQHLKGRLQPIPREAYDGSRMDTYVDKKPVIVDGNSYKAFVLDRIRGMYQQQRAENPGDYSEDDVLLTLGSPRKMANAKYTAITRESRENILLIARGAEMACGMSLIETTARSFILQGGRIRVWAYHKNRLYKAYKDSHFEDYDISEGIDEICAAISSLRQKIAAKEYGNELIILLGMEQICSDFELIDFGGPIPHNTAAPVDHSKYVAKTEEELAAVNEVIELQNAFNEAYDIDALEDQWLDDGKSLEEIQEEEERLYLQFLAERGVQLPPQTEQQPAVPAEEEKAPEQSAGAYNAMEDFRYIVKQGSRFGYHFMLCLNDVSDLRSVQLQSDLFRHKLAFQISADDSSALFGTRAASRLPEHICQYSDSLEQHSLRPYIHRGITWDGWEIGPDGEAVNAIIL